VVVKEFETEQQGAAWCSEQGARDAGALCPDHLGGENAKPDAVFLSCRAGYFLCKLTSQHSSPRESVLVRIRLRPSGEAMLPGRSLAAPA